MLYVHDRSIEIQDEELNREIKKIKKIIVVKIQLFIDYKTILDAEAIVLSK